MQKLRERLSLTIVGLVIASLGVVGPILWDFWSKKTELTVTTESVAPILSAAQGIDGLRVEYAGKEIGELSRVVLTLRNTGRIAITKQDVVTDIHFTPASGEILEARALARHPSNLSATISSDGSSVALRFDLLNPGEFVTIAALISSRDPKISTSARIRNITAISTDDSKDAISLRRGTAVSVAIVGVFGSIFAMVSIVMLMEVLKKSRSIRTLTTSSHGLLSADSLAEARSYVNGDLAFLTDDNRRRVDEALDAAAWPLTLEAQDEMRRNLVSAISDEPSMSAALVSLVLTAVAIWFIINRTVT